MGKLFFLTGCGRSGTTILGQLLERHPDVVYLNDRFDLWIDVLPIADIWGMSDHDAQRRGKIELTANDVEDSGVFDAIGQIRSRLEEAGAGSPVLIEKLAINNFRLGFLHAAFPEASFINITRHGVEVAASIAQKIDVGEWYGVDERKWGYLCEHAEAIGLGGLAQGCTTPLQRGLLEWRMSVESAARVFKSQKGIDVLHTSYEQMLADPRELAKKLSLFLGLPMGDAMGDWAAANVARRSRSALEAEAPFLQDAQRIAGDALRQLGFGIGERNAAFPASERATH